MGRVRGGGGVRRGRGGGDGLGVCGEGSGGGCFFFFFFPCSGRPGRHDEASGRRSRGEPGSPPTPPPQPRRAGVLSPPRRPARGHARQTTLGARPPCAAADQRGGSQVADHPAPPPAFHAGSHPPPPQRLPLGAAAADGSGSPLPPLPPRPPPGCCGRSAVAPSSLGRRWASRGTAGGCRSPPPWPTLRCWGRWVLGPPTPPRASCWAVAGSWGRPSPLTRPPLGCSGPRRPPGTPPGPLFLLLDLAPLLQLLGGAPHDQILPALRLPHWPQPLGRRQASPPFRATRRGRAGPAGLAAAATQPTPRRALSSPHRRRCRRHGHRRCYPRRRHLCRRGRLRGDCAAAGTRSRGPATSAAAAQWRPPGPWGEGMVRGVAAAGGTPLRTTGGGSPLRRPPPPAPAPRRWPPIVPSP